jgi:hypothetical protein
MLATLLGGQGVSVKLTQEMLRHANSRITLELYVQSSMEKHQRASFC